MQASSISDLPDRLDFQATLETKERQNQVHVRSTTED